MIGAEPFLIAPSTRRGDARQPSGLSPRRDAVDKRRAAPVALAHHGVVDPRKRADVLRPHLAVVVGAAEDGHDLGLTAP